MTTSRRVYLHVGTPKSGTSYLQDKLAINRDELERQGLEYPRARTDNHFEAALDLIGDTWAGEEKAARGRWDGLAQIARRTQRDVLISHEILAAADADAVARAMASFPEQEVHVVLTARDLGRQIPAEWQERIKHRGGRDYGAFLKALSRNYGRTDWMMWFWRVQHLPHILATWGASLPPERVHLVTVPPAGGPRDALWSRFASVLGLSPEASYAESETTNASLGGAEVTMLRRLNDALREQEVPRPVYVHWVRESIVKDVLARRPGKVPATVPPRRRAAVEQITATWLAEIRASGVDVVGDLTDLEPVWPDDEGRWVDPDQADPEVVAEAAIEALAHVLARVGRKPVAEDDTGAVARLTRMLPQLMPTSASQASYDEVVAGWADHLRSGGTTTWSAWLEEPEVTGPPVGPRPDAVHLELVRRLNLVAARPVPGLAERVLTTASPGRGLVDVPLLWPAEPRTYGSPAMDPEQLPDEELIRLAVGVIAHLLPGLPQPAVAVPPRGWPLPWRRRFQIHGSPATAAAVRRGLLAQGLVESDWRPTHVVIARPVEVMMAEHWAGKCRQGGILKWSTLWRREQAAGRLPAPIDVAAIARRFASRKREPLHVVIARDVQEAAAAAARLLGARSFVIGGAGELAESDLHRRVNRLTTLVAGPDAVRDLSARLAAVLSESDLVRDAPPPPTVPPGAETWAREQALSTATQIRAAGYAVHGDPDELIPADHGRPGTVDRTRTLQLALAACLRTWQLQEGAT